MWSNDNGRTVRWVLLLVGQAKATYWLNSLDSYNSLPVCAEAPISSIVRDMVSGCGDGGRLTSYSCFCTRSSKAFQNIIATAVSKECSHSGSEVASATSIFHEYCQLGNSDDATTTEEVVEASTTADVLSTEPSSTDEVLSTSETSSTDESSTVTKSSLASKTAEEEESSNTTASTIDESSASSDEPSSLTSSSSSLSTSSASSSTSGGLSTSSKIAIGICVPISLLSLSTLALLLIRRRRKTPDDSDRVRLESRDQGQDFSQKFPQELPGGDHFPRPYVKAELAGSTASVGVLELAVSNQYELA
ncbi:hypothetical protein QQX98_012949 [Neonectria punicea]|uniref:Extracellular membrane protein CFEM domain-containing protein n=1 Tax=Neonectria punicea TaxID=979145 RepID=A0ABR1GHU4_9HYPO